LAIAIFVCSECNVLSLESEENETGGNLFDIDEEQQMNHDRVRFQHILDFLNKLLSLFEP